jgi:hypothetical protein
MASIWSAGNHLVFLFCTAGCCQPCACRPCSSSRSSRPGRSQPESQRSTAATMFCSGETFTLVSCTMQRLLVLPLVCMTWRVANHVATAMQSGLTAQQLRPALAHQGLLQGHQQPELQRHQLQQHSSLTCRYSATSQCWNSITPCSSRRSSYKSSMQSSDTFTQAAKAMAP